MTTKTDKAIQDGNRTATAELTNLGIEESSGVDDGDNPEAHVAMMKAKKEQADKEAAERAERPGFFAGAFAKFRTWAGMSAVGKNAEKYGESQPMTVGQILAVEAFKEKFWKLRMAFVSSMYSILESASADKMGELMAQSAAEFSTEAAAIAAGLKKEKRGELASIIEQMTSALSDPTLPQQNKRRIVGAIEKLEAFEFVTEDTAGDGGAGDGEPNNNQENTMSTANKNAPAVTTAPASEPTEFQKLAARMDAQDKELASTKARAEEVATENKTLKEKLAAMEAATTENTFMAKARDIGVPGMKFEEVAAMLKSAYAVSAETGAAMEKHLRGTSAMANGAVKILSATRGATMAGQKDADETTPHGKLLAAAKKLQTSDAKLSDAAAYTLAMKQNPKLAKAAILN